MHPMTTEVIAARRADLLREAERARRVAAARRRGALGRSTWRVRVGALFIGLGEAVAGRPRAALALPQSERRA
jgi:hypothetical protein